MKKTLLPLLALTLGMAHANAEKKLVKVTNFSITMTDGVETSRIDNGGNTYYFNKNNQKVLETTSYSKATYSYKTDGTADKKYNYSWDSLKGWYITGYNEDVFDAEGNLTAVKTYNLEDSLLSSVIYSDYENGYYKKMQNAYGDGEVYYEITYKYTWNEQNQPLTGISYNGENANSKTTYTYNAEGKLETETSQYSDNNGGWAEPHAENTYYYNADGSIDHVWQKTVMRGFEYITDVVYTYSEIAASYAPTISSVQAVENNCVKLEWNAVEGATAYNVIYDQTVEQVTETTFTSPTLLDGTHDFYVQTIVDGDMKNVSEVATCSVKDEGKKPATNFAVGKMSQDEDEYGNVQYLIEASWTLPTDASPITGIKVYYGDNSWECQNADATATSFTLLLGDWNLRKYDNELFEYTDGLEMNFSVVISYATGDSERSNIVTCIPYDIITGIENVKAESMSEKANVYTLSGICIRKNVNTNEAVKGLSKGIYIIESNNTALKVNVQ